MAIEWNQLRAIFDRHQRFLLTSHVRPDCDAIGSELAMAQILDSLNKQVQIVNADQLPPRLAFIDPQSRIQVLPADRAASSVPEPDVIMVLDTSAWGQLGAMGDFIRRSSAQIVVVDHHAGAPEVEGHIFQDAQAEATGRLVYDLACLLNVPIGPAMATELFAAIATDTGWFRFPSTTSRTYQVIAALVQAGANPSEIFRQLYEQDSLRRIQLRSIVLSNIALELEGRLAHTYVLRHDFQATGALPSETEDFINMAMTISGTEVAMMLTEQAENRWKLSLRSRSDFDCSKIAGTFGGGGHQKAAGATLEGTLPEIQHQVLTTMRAAMAD